MAGVESHSEYEGGGVMPNTVFPKGSDALTPSDKLRLQSLTGQEEDSQAPLNPYHWNGGIGPDLVRERADRNARLARQQQINREAAARYKESPPNFQY